ncbi:glycosyltransferase family 4 protein [Bdellovibrionota bacterium FG-2]
MSTILFLTQRMRMGFGVSVVIDELARRLVARGYSVAVGCYDVETQASTPYPVHLIEPTVDSVRDLALKFDQPILVPQASPFFEICGHLSGDFDVWAWEHGDPTPSFFDHDAAERTKIQEDKRIHCYPKFRGVIASSEFLRTDIDFAPATVIYLASDHVPDVGSKNLQDFPLERNRPLRVGTLMRLGKGEAFYKGNELFLKVCEALHARKVPVELCVMGRGTEEDAQEFEAQGIRVLLNAPDHKKAEYLRNLDVFLSCSIWEGFNLPVTEAQALGTLSLAFDAGSHPEVCPFLFSHVDEMVEFICEMHLNRGLLNEYSRMTYHFVRGKFGWDRTVDAFLNTLGLAILPAQGVGYPVLGRMGRKLRSNSKLRKFVKSWSQDGALETFAKVGKFVKKKLG